MHPSFKPAGYNSVSPYFIVDDARLLIDLLKEIFGAKELRRFDRADGKIMHAEVMLDDSVIMLSDATSTYPAIKAVMHVYSSNVDATIARAKAAGCHIEEPVQQREGDPDRRGTFIDCCGNMWSVGQMMG